jgi:hypothetical protein
MERIAENSNFPTAKTLKKQNSRCPTSGKSLTSKRR